MYLGQRNLCARWNPALPATKCNAPSVRTDSMFTSVPLFGFTRIQRTQLHRGTIAKQASSPQQRSAHFVRQRVTRPNDVHPRGQRSQNRENPTEISLKTNTAAWTVASSPNSQKEHYSRKGKSLRPLTSSPAPWRCLLLIDQQSVAHPGVFVWPLKQSKGPKPTATLGHVASKAQLTNPMCVFKPATSAQLLKNS